MIEMRLSEAAAAVNAALIGDDRRFTGCATDSRMLEPDQLFVALRGPNFDGHDYVADVLGKGASGAMVERSRLALEPRIEVDDTRRALGELASTWRRRQSNLQLAAVTGSNGKTTVKNMLAAILAETGNVHATPGNLNNDIGVPLTLFALRASHAFAVVEMGANHPGEIARLAEIAQPDVAVVTQCAPAHLEGFGSIDGVARAKGEIYEGLGADGIAVINGDDPYAGLWHAMAGSRPQVFFGIDDPGADIRAHNIEVRESKWGSRFDLVTPSGSVTVELAMPGRHNIMNALAAASCALMLGCPLDVLPTGLAKAEAATGRLNLVEVGGLRIVDDSYNANPASLRAGIDTALGLPGPHWLVLGDMAELGEDAQRLHHDIGHWMADRGIARLFTVGGLSASTAAAFGPKARHFEDLDQLIAALLDELPRDATILVKGSRAAATERVVAALRNRERGRC
jgi:UDP-N-acetylmuramoyl-tripeptide--D-alanyl-D-alanine ligase